MSDASNISYKNRIAFHHRKAQGVLAEIKDRYPIQKDGWTIPPSIEKHFMQNFAQYLQEGESAEKWHETIAMAQQDSGLPEHRLDTTFETIATEFAPRFADAFYVHRQLYDCQSAIVPDVYKSEFTRHSLGHIYKNHLCNELHARLCETGLNEKSAYYVFSQIARIARVSGNDTELVPFFIRTISPVRDRKAPVETEIDNLHYYWRHQRKEMQKAYGLQAPLNSSITRTNGASL